ncbi:hypothetical protein ACFLTH_06405 [Bacteroidota bacterium]
MKKIFTLLLFTAVGLLISSCTPSRRSMYKSDHVLNADRAESLSTELTVRIPEGWIPVEDNKNRSVDLWLVSDDLTASIVFTPIHIDLTTMNEIHENESDDLMDVLEYSKTIRKALHGDDYKEVREDEYFTINGKPFAAYQFSREEQGITRVIIFRYLNHFFEMSAEFKNSADFSAEDYENLFNIQNSVISSLK